MSLSDCRENVPQIICPVDAIVHIPDFDMLEAASRRQLRFRPQGFQLNEVCVAVRTVTGYLPPLRMGKRFSNKNATLGNVDCELGRASRPLAILKHF